MVKEGQGDPARRRRWRNGCSVSQSRLRPPNFWCPLTPRRRGLSRCVCPHTRWDGIHWCGCHIEPAIYKERFPFRIPFYSNGCDNLSDCKCCTVYTVCELVHVPSPQFEAFCIPGPIGSLNDLSCTYIQSASTEAAFPVSETVLTHLNSLAKQLMNTETQLYEKCRPPVFSLYVCMYHHIMVGRVSQFVRRGKERVT